MFSKIKSLEIIKKIVLGVFLLTIGLFGMLQNFDGLLGNKYDGTVLAMDMNIPESDTSPPGRTMLSLLLSPTEAWVLRDLLEEIAKGSSTSPSTSGPNYISTPSRSPK